MLQAIFEIQVDAGFFNCAISYCSPYSTFMNYIKEIDENLFEWTIDWMNFKYEIFIHHKNIDYRIIKLSINKIWFLWKNFWFSNSIYFLFRNESHYFFIRFWCLFHLRSPTFISGTPKFLRNERENTTDSPCNNA